MRAVIGLILVTTALQGQAPRTSPTTQAIDADLWSVIVKSVADADFEAMASTYHPDAVVVGPGRTTPIQVMMPLWKRSGLADKTKGIKHTVEFRFASRLDDSASAFETGIFKYSSDSAGVVKSDYVPFEVLAVKRNGKWRVVMEHQLPATDLAGWNKLRP